MSNRSILTAFGATILALGSCSPEKEESGSEKSTILVSSKADVEFRVREGLSEEQSRIVLEKEAQGVRAALDAGVGQNPETRTEIAWLLIKRHRDALFSLRFKASLATLTDEGLRGIYEKNIDRYRRPERRQVAVLWLDSGKDPTRKGAFIEKLQKART